MVYKAPYVQAQLPLQYPIQYHWPLTLLQAKLRAFELAVPSALPPDLRGWMLHFF